MAETLDEIKAAAAQMHGALWSRIIVWGNERLGRWRDGEDTKPSVLAIDAMVAQMLDRAFAAGWLACKGAGYIAPALSAAPVTLAAHTKCGSREEFEALLDRMPPAVSRAPKLGQWEPLA